MFIFPYKDDNPSYSFPYLTIALIAANVFFFVEPSLTGAHNRYIQIYGYTPVDTIFRPWGIFTSIFLHAGIIHLVSNMWFLWIYGDNIEDRCGRFTFIRVYIMAGITGNLLHALFSFFQSPIPVIGASGAVAGIMGMYMVRFPWANIRCLFLLIIFPIFLNIRAFWLLGFWMLFEFIHAFSFSSSNVAHWAHVGGFAYGFMVAWKAKKNPDKNFQHN